MGFCVEFVEKVGVCFDVEELGVDLLVFVASVFVKLRNVG